MDLVEEEAKCRRECEFKRLELQKNWISLDERRLELDAKAQEAQEEVRKNELGR